MPRLAYYASHISDNILDQGRAGIICLNVPLARTGWQTYLGKELGEDFQKEFNVGDEDKIKVYRSPEEVLKPEAIASFETKTVTDNHPPDRTWVDGDNYKDFLRGHVQNVRKGTEKLDDEDVVVGDLAVIDAQLAKEILNEKKREISCGYDYKLKLRPDGNFEQVDIRGNHVAVVPNGRAGDKVRINDAAPAERGNEMPTMTKPTGISWTDFLRAVGFKHFATDAKPEELAEAQKELQQEDKHMPDEKKRLSEDELKAKEDDLKRREDDVKRREDDARHRERDKRNDDAQSKEDRAAWAQMRKDGTADDPEDDAKPKRGRDRRDDDRNRSDDRREDDKYSRMADKLMRKYGDRRLDDVDTEELADLLNEFFEKEGEEPQHQDDKRGRDRRDDDRHARDRGDDDRHGRDRRDDDRRVKDVDTAKLAELLDKFFAEEGKEPEHQGDKRSKDRRDDDEIEPIDNPADLEKKDKKKADEDAEVLEPVKELPKKDQPENPIPGADAALDALRVMRPIVARSKDKEAIAKFNRALDSLQPARSATTRGSYGALTNLVRSQGTDSIDDRNAAYAKSLNDRIGRPVGQKEA